MEQTFEERIARAKEAAQRASLAVLARTATPAAPIDTARVVPADIAHRVDRLLEFIDRNGAAFEDTVRERERSNPEFAFLFPGGAYHEYYTSKKRQLVTIDPIFSLPVGAMANACISARQRGLPAYAPLPQELLVASPAVVHSVEPARLDTRLAEFYRDAYAR